MLSVEPLAQLAGKISLLEAKLDDVLEALKGNTKPLLTVDEIAGLTGRSAYTVRRWIAQKLISATRVNGTGPRGRLLIAREQLDRILQKGLGESIVANELYDA